MVTAVATAQQGLIQIAVKLLITPETIPRQKT